MAGRFFEDFSVGEVIESPETYEITAENLHAFATEFDPQPMHLDDRAARGSFFGELVTSGWQTLAITMRLMVLSPLFASGEVVGVGVDNLRWLAPVVPGSRLRARAEVVEVKTSRTRPERGFMKLHVTTLDANDLPVASQDWTVMVPRRPQLS